MYSSVSVRVSCSIGSEYASLSAVVNAKSRTAAKPQGIPMAQIADKSVL
jgi:hypothetical protein